MSEGGEQNNMSVRGPPFYYVVISFLCDRTKYGLHIAIEKSVVCHACELWSNGDR